MAGLNWWFACPYKEIPCFFKKMTILLREIHAIISVAFTDDPSMEKEVKIQ